MKFALCYLITFVNFTWYFVIEKQTIDFRAKAYFSHVWITEQFVSISSNSAVSKSQERMFMPQTNHKWNFIRYSTVNLIFCFMLRYIMFTNRYVVQISRCWCAFQNYLAWRYSGLFFLHYYLKKCTGFCPPERLKEYTHNWRWWWIISANKCFCATPDNATSKRTRQNLRTIELKIIFPRLIYDVSLHFKSFWSTCLSKTWCNYNVVMLLTMYTIIRIWCYQCFILVCCWCVYLNLDAVQA